MARTGTARRRARAAAMGLSCLVLAVALAPPAQARPVTVEDLLQREDLGAAAITPEGRYLLFERRGPYASATRFDLQLFNPLFRTRIEVVDLSRPGGPRPLLPARAGAGYQLGPASPDGRQVVVYRYLKDRWRAGLAAPATGRVRWLSLTPELPGPARTLQWLSPQSLVAIARAPGDLPYELRWMSPAPAVAARWRATAGGGLAVSAVGSGRYLGLRPQAPPGALVRVDAHTRAVRVLARGEFTDLEASPDGRWLAALEADEDIPLAANRPVQGPYGIATRRQRLTLVNLETGQVRRRALPEDLLGFLSWSPASRALLVFGRSDGAPWTEGRLIAVDPTHPTTDPLAPTLQPAIERRPETVYAGWWGETPLVFARNDPGGRLDWWRLDPGGPVRLTRDLTAPPRRGLIAEGGALRLLADGAAWVIDRQGHATRLAADLQPLAERPAGVPPRTAFAVLDHGPLLARRAAPGGGRIAELATRGAIAGPSLAAGETLVAAAPNGALVLRDLGGAQVLAWRARGAADRVLGGINRRFRGVDSPEAVAVHHTGPNGEALTSWVLLPTRPFARSAPLIVEAYLGTVYGPDPRPWLYADGPLIPTAALLAHGYAVLLPSLPVRRPSAGPGDRLAAQILAVADAAAATPALQGRIDPTRLGLWGHSFGGYTVMQTLTQTGRFRAAWAQAGMSDLASVWGPRTIGRRVFGDADTGIAYSPGWTEDLQGDMGAPPWARPDRYLANSPLFHADRITTPLMLVHGDLDQFDIGQSEAMFTALARQDKDAILVTYFGEKHLYASPGTYRDYYRRLFAWFDQHLQL